METKINIAAILKDKPTNTKLYSPLFGDAYFSYVGSRNNISVLHHGTLNDFLYDGRYVAYKEAETLLFPSREMRDWNKFAWKKGDVLISNDGKKEVFFNGFADDTYALFKAKHGFEVLPNGNTIYIAKEEGIATDDYVLEDNDAAQTYINTIEERLGGKLNRKTLEIEPAQPEFKDGDIVFVESHMLGINTSSMIAIFRKEKEIDKYRFSPALCESKEHDTYLREDSVVLSPSDIKIFRPATDSEKQQLFDALTKEGKAWDAEKKAIVDLKPKVKLKPFDKVLVRNDKEDQWSANIFSYQIRDMYYCLGECYWRYCIPYKDNESLLGTTKDAEG